MENVQGDMPDTIWGVENTRIGPKRPYVSLSRGRSRPDEACKWRRSVEIIIKIKGQSEGHTQDKRFWISRANALGHWARSRKAVPKSLTMPHSY